MKELSIEEKAKCYDEAIERAQSLKNKWIDEDGEDVAFMIFPELKGSDDEQVRKAMIDFFKHEREEGVTVLHYGVNIERMIAWLEKQGEPKPTDKVEPKFHEGEWIVWQNKCYKVYYNGCGYELIDQDGLSTSLEYGTIDESAHLWDVTKDAKDGDVLWHSDSASNGIFIFKEIRHDGKVLCYCDYDSEDHFCLGEHHTCCWTDAKILHPATKEQRDTLEKAMTDAGYIFDFESKELKKLGQSEVTKMSDQEEIAEIPFGAKDSELQEATYYIPKGFHAEIDDDKVVIKKDEKPTAWSEEDEQITLSIEQVMNCASLLNIVPEKTDKIRTWLKSLKQRIGG